jgi:lysophospholipase L1-like esterase
MEKVAVDPSLMQPDGLHPTAKAQAMIKDLVSPVLKQL